MKHSDLVNFQKFLEDYYYAEIFLQIIPDGFLVHKRYHVDGKWGQPTTYQRNEHNDDLSKWIPKE
jgi:hypothetical protein